MGAIVVPVGVFFVLCCEASSRGARGLLGLVYLSLEDRERKWKRKRKRMPSILIFIVEDVGGVVEFRSFRDNNTNYLRSTP
jgi:hypothetical protein